MRRSLLALLALLLALAAAPAGAQTDDEPTGDDGPTVTGKSEEVFDERVTEEHRIETSHGTLYGEIIRPAVDGEPVTGTPIILTLSPYNVISAGVNGGPIAEGRIADFYVPRGYARAVFDVVGTRDSSGCFDYGGIRERESGAELVDALGSMEWTNGKVGMIGGSYDGTTQIAAAIEQPEHLAAIIPQVAIDRWYDYAFGGGIRYNTNNEDPTSQGFDTPFAFDFGFGLLPPGEENNPTASAAVIAERITPCDQLEHTEAAYLPDPVYDEFWEERDYRSMAGRIQAPTLIEGGWLDYNVKYWDSTLFFQALPDDLPKHLIMGQWGHTSSRFSDAADLRHAWFDTYLMGLETGVEDLPPVQTQLNTQADDEREREESWPPPGTREASLRLTDVDQVDVDALALTSGDPTFIDNNSALSEMQMLSDADPTASFIRFSSQPLSEPVRISGGTFLDLVASTEATSTHFMPVLYEEKADGSREVITRGFLNARNRDGLDVSEPLVPGEAYRASVPFWDIDWQLQAGSRLGVVVASQNFPWATPDDNRDVGPTSIGIEGGDLGTSVLRVPISEGAAALGLPPLPPAPEPTPPAGPSEPTPSEPPATEPPPPGGSPGGGDDGGEDDGDGVARVAGADRVATALEVSRATVDAADAVVVARADTYPDALAGGPLAASLGSPLLLTDPDRLSDGVADEAERLGADRAVLLGGEAALSPRVAADLVAAGLTVERVAGADRFATAAAIEDRLPADTGPAVVVEGMTAAPQRGWPDAVSGAWWAATSPRPVLLATRDDLPEVTGDAVGDRDAQVVGGVAAISPAVADELEDRGATVERVAGADRYATSAAVLAASGAPRDVLWLATGSAFPDALTAGAAAQPVLLVDGDGLDGSPAARDAIRAAGEVRILGGTDAVSEAVEAEVRSLRAG